jgi:hypothetical protein
VWEEPQQNKLATMSLLKYAKATADEVVEILRSDPANGLSTTSVESLQKVHGPNKLEEDEKVGWLGGIAVVCAVGGYCVLSLLLFGQQYS